MLTFVSFLLVVSTMFGQTANPLDSHSVTVPLFVSDHKGPVKLQLNKDNIVLRDDKSAIPVTDIQDATTLPLRIGVVIDTSNSQRSNLVYKRTVEEIVPFLQRLMTGPNDRAFIETFDSTFTLSDFVDTAGLRRLSMPLTVGGGTAFYDAIVVGCNKIDSDTLSARRMLIVFSDGDDNQSRHTRDEAIKRALESSVAVITLNTGNGTSDRGVGELKRIGDATGGFSFTYMDQKKIPSVFQTITQFINSMYEVTFVPSADKPGKLHKLDLQLDDPQKLTLWRPRQYVSK